MADTLEERACQLAVYIIETGATVRNAAEKFGISKSTVHSVYRDTMLCFTDKCAIFLTEIRRNGIFAVESRRGTNIKILSNNSKRARVRALTHYRSSASCTGRSAGSNGTPE